MPGLISLTLEGKMQLPALKSPAYGLLIGICRLVPDIVQALHSCLALPCRMLLEAFGCSFLVALLHLVL